MASSLHTLERRILALEARLADVEDGDGNPLHQLRRTTVKLDLRTGKMLDHLGIEDVSDDDIDAALDAE